MQKASIGVHVALYNAMLMAFLGSKKKYYQVAATGKGHKMTWKDKLNIHKAKFV